MHDGQSHPVEAWTGLEKYDSGNKFSDWYEYAQHFDHAVISWPLLKFGEFGRNHMMKPDKAGPDWFPTALMQFLSIMR